ncbi:glycoside hydrolase family 31 protein [Undibacterium aquatile]|nr:TIM-barrel domain-containing protein [Undibacterium aquatile]
MKQKTHFKRISCLATLALLMQFCVTDLAAQNLSRSIQRVSVQPAYLEVVTNDGRYLFKPYTKNIIETSFIPAGEHFQQASHAVVLKPEKIKAQLRTDAQHLSYIAGNMAVHINRAPFQISYTYKNKALIAEHEGYQQSAQGRSLDFQLDQDEALYGAGARALGMNRRGYRLPLYNKAHYGYEEHSEQMNFAMPLVFSSKMYGIHFDNPTTGFLDLDSKKKNLLAYESLSGRQTYQVIAGDSWEDIVSAYTQLTGRQPLPPRWAFGNFASRFGYHSESEARSVLAKYKEEQIPVDAIIFDLYWFGKEIKGTMGNLAFDRDNFPQPKKMIADFAQQGVKTILITEPFILTSSARWKEAVTENILAKDQQGQPYTYDFYFGHTGLIDLFDKHAQQWFWNIYKNLKAEGVAGWWGDLGEPEVHPAGLQHQTGSAEQVHNIYGHQWAKLIAEGYRKEYPQERPFILMRAGYSGSQRFGMIPWSGDVNRTWGGLRSQPEIALQMGMQGMAYMHSDLGGFAGANLDDELYTRWLQYGVFQPVFRPHAQEEVASEPVFREPATRALAKAAIALRYRLLPYNYTLAFENNQHGWPLMRPLFFAEPMNPVLTSASDSYLWGRDLLVHPVLSAGQKKADIYFPVSSNWFDFYTGQTYAAGSRQSIDIVREHIPVFVRGGAFIPMTKPLQNTREYSTQTLDLHYYYDPAVASSQSQLYDDDGMTAKAFERGAYTLMKFHSAYRQRQLVLTLDAVNGKNNGNKRAVSDRRVQMVIHNIAAAPEKILLQHQPVAFAWDASSRQVTLDVLWKAGSTAKLVVQMSE